jgi:phosphatidylethanolamine/phosphatidyl-N-methylethanolamine N-methyltransferase
MQSPLQQYDPMADRAIFLHEFLKHPNQVGSIIPSSRFLERRIVGLAQVQSARTIIELGGGTGGTTRAILAAMSPVATLLSIEINPQFCALLRRIRDNRLIVHYGCAQDLANALSLHGLPAPEAIVSGIPFSTMSRPAGSRILAAICAALAPAGRFVAYQVSTQVDDLARPLLGPARVEVELFNIPPMRLYQWQKHPA